MKKVGVVVLLLLLVLSSLFGAEAIKRGGMLRVTPMKQGVLIQNFNPFSPNSLEVAVGCFYETLVFYNQGTGKFHPWLATAYEWSNDLKELTFTLRDGVVWNDGTPFTIQDVLFTMELGKKFPGLNIAPIWKQGLVDVVARTSNSVTFVFDRVNTTLIYRVADIFIVPRHIWKDVEDPLTWTGNLQPVGTGPFVYEAGSFTEQSFKVIKNPRYWQIAPDGKPLPYIDGIVYISTTNEQVGLRLARGEYDWAGYFVANIDEVYVQADPEHHKYWLPEGNLVYLNLNNLREPFNNYNVRYALNFALDNKEITRIMASGAVPSSPGWVKTPFLYLAKEALDKAGIEYDPDYTKELLEKEGYRLNAKGIYEKAGKALSFNLYVPTGWTDWIMGCEEIARQLKEVGIEAIVTQAAWPSPYVDDYLYYGNYEMCLGISVTGAGPYFQLEYIAHPRAWAPLGERSANYYGMRYKSEEIGRLLDSYTQEPLESKRDEIMKKALSLFLKDSPSVPLFFNPTWYEYNTKLFVGWPSEEDPYCFPSPNGMHKLPLLLKVHLR
ncbi:MAG TPA: ABC transporter substrate-binding protein [Thermotogota bacterium]|nr:ABC transporter substrate-binding protein [Thermotogota bacterium]NLH19987.1 ABC transporter substrate-binding protein [Thermotogaceae bacterium]OQC30888.1 MAG: Nickel-binding periplasmic protein precursor [Thermotogota bacterium ADurb.Bin062]HNW46949.1 ABC transporter substrate-binding protein [Thermotogota bacterium]HNY82856.1 ABC transporter substrate-binding protein [Thermotogota bacterium]